MASPIGLRSICLRYFNAAGADPDGEIGEEHAPETHLIPLVMDAALGKRSHIKVFGDDYDTLDGTCIRDNIHVSDLAQAHVLAIHWLENLPATSNQPPVSAFNLGNGQGGSVTEVIEMVERVGGRSMPVQTVTRRPGDPLTLVGDATKIRRELNWQPHYHDLETIIETAWRWTNKS